MVIAVYDLLRIKKLLTKYIYLFEVPMIEKTELRYLDGTFYNQFGYDL